MSRIILFNKPYGVLPQFTDKGTEGSPRPTLSQFVDVPGVYPAGRLDMDSEGLMLLTDDGRLQARISDPKYKMAKSYLVQVEGDVADDALVRLRRGVSLKDGLTRPARPSGLQTRCSGRAIRRSVCGNPSPMAGSS